jgi:hypothetical protein
MSLESYVVGPGTLTLGETGSEIQIECQLTSCVVAWDVDADDDVPLLCGEVAPGDEVFTATISGNLFQDLSTGGIVEWSWTNKGTVQPVVFVPSTAEAKEVVGSVKVRPIDIGGDAKAKARSDFEWPFVGEPDLQAVTP